MDGYAHKWMIWFNDCDLLQSNTETWKYIWKKTGPKLITVEAGLWNTEAITTFYFCIP